ncbi:MAG: PaaI family thioesterase [Candidatus Hydrogenedentota bacterium]|nr:MAG: PaaI family thioesterase [Candidatus Hydrogenedentota bacterium]
MKEVKPTLRGQDWHKPDCYGCGPENKNGLHAEFTFDEETGEVRFPYVAPPYLKGAPGYMHGGAIATLLDEAQGALCYHLGHMIMTDKLTIKYHKATPLGEEIYIRCWVTAVRKRRMYTRGIIYNKDEEVLVSSSAVWYLLPERVLRKLFKEENWPESERQYRRAVLEANRQRAKKIRRRLREQKKNGSKPHQ